MSALLIIIYLSFISLGLPDSLLGSAWPVMHQQLNLPLSYSGILFMTISLGTVISSLNSDRLTKKYGTGMVTFVSVSMTMLALFGNSFSHSFLSLFLWAIPYGLGAGSVDAALNNYVALNYASRHMSWLHCMWGVGASIGPYFMSLGLRNNENWHLGYRYIAILQLLLSILLFLSLSKWKKEGSEEETETVSHLPLLKVMQITGVKEIMLSFFCYCALEQTTGLWASSWLVGIRGIDEVKASAFASLYYLGITIGRALSGFITYKLDDKNMVRLGEGILLLGLLCLVQNRSETLSLYGLVILGLGSAPVYPSLIHSTPQLFGKDRSQSIIGVQMASAYVGNIVMPPLFGLIARNLGLQLFPFYLTVLTVSLILLHERLRKEAGKE